MIIYTFFNKIYLEKKLNLIKLKVIIKINLIIIKMSSQEIIKLDLFNNSFFEWQCSLLATKFYIDGNELKIILMRSTFFSTVEVEIKTSEFHIIKQLFSNELVRLNYQFNYNNQMVFANIFLKSLYIKVKKPREIIADIMIIYYEPKYANGVETLLEYCKLNKFIKFKKERAYPNIAIVN